MAFDLEKIMDKVTSMAEQRQKALGINSYWGGTTSNASRAYDDQQWNAKLDRIDNMNKHRDTMSEIRAGREQALTLANMQSIRDEGINQRYLDAARIRRGDPVNAEGDIYGNYSDVDGGLAGMGGSGTVSGRGSKKTPLTPEQEVWAKRTFTNEVPVETIRSEYDKAFAPKPTVGVVSALKDKPGLVKTPGPGSASTTTIPGIASQNDIPGVMSQQELKKQYDLLAPVNERRGQSIRQGTQPLSIEATPAEGTYTRKPASGIAPMSLETALQQANAGYNGTSPMSAASKMAIAQDIMKSNPGKNYIPESTNFASAPMRSIPVQQAPQTLTEQGMVQGRPARRPNGAELGGRDYDPNINPNWSRDQMAAYDASQAGRAARNVSDMNAKNWDTMVANKGVIAQPVIPATSFAYPESIRAKPEPFVATNLSKMRSPAQVLPEPIGYEQVVDPTTGLSFQREAVAETPSTPSNLSASNMFQDLWGIERGTSPVSSVFPEELANKRKLRDQSGYNINKKYPFSGKKQRGSRYLNQDYDRYY